LSDGEILFSSTLSGAEYESESGGRTVQPPFDEFAHEPVPGFAVNARILELALQVRECNESGTGNEELDDARAAIAR